MDAASSMTWSERVKYLIEKGVKGIEVFADLTDEDIIKHPFFEMLNSLWQQTYSAPKKTAKKHILSEEEKEKMRRDKINEVYGGLSTTKNKKIVEDIKKDFGNIIGEEGVKSIDKKALNIGLEALYKILSEIKAEAPKATKTLANGRVVANHNGYEREESELVRDESGKIKKVVVEWPKKGRQTCVVAPTNGDEKMTKGWSFEGMEDLKSIDPVKAGTNQIFIKKMMFSTDPKHIEGRCKCIAALNKKIQLFAYDEIYDEEKDVIRYERHLIKNPPIFACNAPIFENGVCKRHNKGVRPRDWTEEDFGEWRCIKINV